MVLQSGSDCVIKVVGTTGVPLGCIALDEAHMYNLHVGPEITRAFKVFLPPANTFALTDITLEGTISPLLLVRSLIRYITFIIYTYI